MHKLLNKLYIIIFTALRKYSLNYGSITKFIRQNAKGKKLSILDFGCGYAQFSADFAGPNTQVFIYDIDQQRLQSNRNFINKHALEITADPGNLNNMDIITIMGVFCLLSEAEIIDTLDTFNRIMNKNGIIILQDLAYGNKISRLNVLKEKLLYKLGLTKSKGNIYMRSNDFYKDLLAKHGFSLTGELAIRDRIPFNLIHASKCYVFKKQASA